MPTANTWKLADAAMLALGLVLTLSLHLVGLSVVPGLHFDEAWAMNFAWRLGSEPFTVHAMSPYTAPWAHYWALLWMKAFGPSLLAFRASQLTLALTGISFLSDALRRAGRPRAGAGLFVVAALVPGFVLNNRFAIELNGLHPFCLGLLAWALTTRRPWLAALAFAVGTSGHILFYGVGLGLLGAAIWEGRAFTRGERAAAVGALLLVAFYFSEILRQVPEKGKAAALLASALGLAGLLLARAERWRLWRWHWWETIVVLVSALFWFNAIFFAEGTWSLALSTGKEGWKSWGAIGMALFIPPALYFAYLGGRELPRLWRRALSLSVIALGLMMLKPAPRYFELVILCLVVLFSLGIARRRLPIRALITAGLLLHALPIYVDYFSLMPHEKDFRFLFFKDSSRDFLSKQVLLGELGGRGCDLSVMELSDSRVAESLRALSLQPPPRGAAACPWPRLRIERRAEARRSGEGGEIADFVYWGIP
jgi:hypothetical protein